MEVGTGDGRLEGWAAPATGRSRPTRGRTSVVDMPVPRAQLKVFSPLEAFALDERETIRAALDRDAGLSRSQAGDLEAAWSIAGLVRGAPPAAPEAVQVRRVADRVMVCPLRLELRAAMAFGTFAAQVPPAVLPAVVPDARRRARMQRPANGVAHVREQPFAAPLPWFLAFRPAEQRFTNAPEGRGPRLVHLTTVGQAGKRLERVIDVVRTVLVDADEVLLELAELGAWFDAFDPVALLELDHGSAGRLRGAAALRRDSTCAQLWRAVDALEEGDDHAAAVAYASARAAWSGSRRLGHAS